MRAIIFIAMFTLLGAGCTDSFVSQVQGFSDTVKAKAAEVSAAFESAKQTVGKVQAIYNILTPSVPPSEDQPQPAVEENTSSQ